MARVGVVVPAYRPDPARLVAYVRSLLDRLDPATVRVELDAPTAATRDALAALPDRVTVNAVDRRRGKGAAVTAGFEALDADVYAFADADGSTPADSLAAVVAPVSEGRADLAVGSRRHPDATVAAHQTRARRLMGDCFAWLARRVLDTGLYDYQCGAKALTAGTWRAVRRHLHEPGFAWDIELVAMVAARDRRIVEVPVVWEDQPGSTVSTGRTTASLAIGLFRSRARAKALSGHRLYALLAGQQPPLIERLGIPDERTEPGD
jgi:glycosyltransferase involved in cell wall biosynthesis